MDSINTNYKFVVILNKNLPTGVAINSASHMALGLVAKSSEQQKQHMSFIKFIDGNNVEHYYISALSLIVLRATNGEIKKMVESFREQDILYVDFLETMTGNTYLEQLERTKQINSDTIVYYGAAAFGLKEVLYPLTKKLSLWRD